MKEVIQRLKGPTPRFFKKVRNLGVSVATIGGAILAAPVALPAGILAVAGYLTVAGTVASVVSQAVTESTDEDRWRDEVK